MIREEVEGVVQELLVARLGDISAQLTAGDHDDDNRYLTTTEAAAIAGVQPGTIRDWIQRGVLPERRAGRLLRVRLRDLHGCMASESTGKSEPIDLNAKATEILRRQRRRKSTRA
jgi:excisionase family DNA binding protein